MENEAGNTPLMLAEMQRHEEITAWLSAHRTWLER
jgi:hypothetical protein